MAELEFRELSVKVSERTLLDRITLRIEPARNGKTAWTEFAYWVYSRL